MSKCRKLSYIAIIIIVIAIILLFSFSYFTNFNINNSSNSNNSINSKEFNLSGEEVTINGLRTLIPKSYQNGEIIVKPGINTYQTKNGSIYVTVYSDSKDGDSVYDGDMEYFAYGKFNEDKNPKRENITLNNQNILYVTQHSDIRGDYRLAFFEAKNKRVMIEWVGSNLSDDVKNIILGFY
ncbi:hypothetical protein [Methanobrevibacter filiformis]|uniref:DUF4367 domain-containing protein n=1 Tax=Methanobrevibacter filiformis TaxID=55758 RepID=A0A165Z0T8_9EURY|nr:hypothetical protein [Methanobrevibacter filiformis]KZX10104.1 hypothetical protein MBFIL_18830 [Methanobrevibacter filiformis]